MDKIFSPIKGRFLEFIEKQGLSKSEFFSELGLSPSNFKGSAAKSELGGEALTKISQACPNLNSNWLLTGAGDMLVDKDSSQKNPTANGSVFNVKLVGQYAYAGYLSGFADVEYMETLPTIPFIIPDGQTTRGQYLAFEVRGDSMDDGSANSLLEGDILLGRLVAPHHYQDSALHYKKWFFIIVHESQGILVKQITAHDVANNTITIHSLNDMYEDVVLHLSDVKKIFNIVQSLRKSKPYPLNEISG